MLVSVELPRSRQSAQASTTFSNLLSLLSVHRLSPLDRSSLDAGPRNGRSKGRHEHVPRAATEQLEGGCIFNPFSICIEVNASRIDTDIIPHPLRYISRIHGLG